MGVVEFVTITGVGSTGSSQSSKVFRFGGIDPERSRSIDPEQLGTGFQGESM